MAFEDEKQAVINAVKEKKCNAAKFINDNATDYLSLLECLFEFAKTFDCDTAYLEELLGLITIYEANAVGCYFNQTLASVTNPRYIAKSNIALAVLDSSFTGDLEIVDESEVDELDITDNITLKNLVIASDAIVDMLVIEDGSTVEGIMLKSCGIKKGTLNKIMSGSTVNNVVKEGDAVFGGYECITDET
jgi:hypothetical protein